MLVQLRRLAIRNIISPYGLAFASLALFIFAWLFPPGLYTEYLGEPDYMFLDGTTLAFFLICCASFVLGVRAFNLFVRPGRVISKTVLQAKSPLLYLAIPLILATLACTGYLFVLGGKINFLALLANQRGNAIKSALHSGGDNSSGSWVHTLSWLTGTLWWAFYRMRQFEMTRRARRGFYFLFGFGVAVDVMTCLATVSRGALMPLVVGIAVIYVYSKATTREIKVAQTVFVCGIAGVAFIGLFIALSFLRGAGSARLIAFALIGYTIASYNRLAAILGGFMHFQFAGNGVYLVPFLVENGTASNFMSAHFGWPPYFAVWQSEFSSTWVSGLNKAFIWAGVFGYVYSEIGWFAPFYMLVTGLFLGWSWNTFQRGKSLGLVLYPFLAFWILFWIGSNVIWNAQFSELLAAGFGLALYDRSWLRRSVTQSQRLAPNGPAVSNRRTSLGAL